MDLNIILTIIGIISPFILAAVWMTTLIARTSNRALLLEVKTINHNERLEKVELATSYSAIKQTVSEISIQLLHSREFKDLMKETFTPTIENAVKNTLLHIEKNRSSERSSAFEEILSEIKHLRSNPTHHNS